jgi:hypothetical protein
VVQREQHRHCSGDEASRWRVKHLHDLLTAQRWSARRFGGGAKPDTAFEVIDPCLQRSSYLVGVTDESRR